MPDIRLPPKIQTFVRRIDDHLPPERGARIKALAAVVILAICVPFIATRLVSSIDLSGPARQPTTPAEVKSREISAKLAEDLRFRDVGLIAESEKPMKFRVFGAVHKEADLEPLRQLLEAELPGIELEYEVIILPE